MTTTARPRRTGLIPAAIIVFLAASIAACIVLRAWNPLFFDAPGTAVVLFVLLPAAAGAVAGGILMVVARRGGPRGTARPALAAFLAALLLVAGLSAESAHREAHPRHTLKCAVIGVDGATWDVIRPLQAEGALPELARLEKEGVSATCITLTPIFSSRVFTSIATGKVAEKHGIIGVSDTAERLKCARLWDILGSRGWKTGTFEWYVTWPPEVRTSGFTVPDIYARSNATSPTSLQFLRDLRIGAKAGRGMGLRESAGYAVKLVRNGARLSTMLATTRFALEAKLRDIPPVESYYRQHFLWVAVETDVFCRLIESYQLDFGGLVYKVTDSVGHKYWKYFQPEFFRNVPEDEVRRYGAVIPDSYRLVDHGLGRIARRIAPDGVLAVISDHGFGPAEAAETGISSLRTGMLLELLGLDKAGWEYVNIGGAASLMLRTDAGDEEHSRMLAAVAARFEAARIRGSGAPVFIVEMQDHPGSGDDCVEIGIRHELAAAVNSDPGAAEAMIDFGGGVTTTLHEVVVTSELSGDHTMEGILVLRGAGVRKDARIADCSVLDLAPTMLALRGLAVGADMDGRVLTEALDPGWLAANPVETVASWDSEKTMPRLTHQDVTDLPPDVVEKLKSLGYMQ